jgi:hypothetical protein
LTASIARLAGANAARTVSIIYYAWQAFCYLTAVGIESANCLAQPNPYILWSFRLTARQPCDRIRANIRPVTGEIRVRAIRPAPQKRAGRQGENDMQFLPGFTVQCINPQCEARGHWLRADATRAFCEEGRCPCCGDSLRNVPPPLGPRFRMRPRPLTARPPLRPRPR